MATVRAILADPVAIGALQFDQRASIIPTSFGSSMQDFLRKINYFEAASLAELQGRLAVIRGQQADNAWPAEQLAVCGEAGVPGWFLPQSLGGSEWSKRDIVRGYLELSAGCLTTAFVLTQSMGACQRIASSKNHALRDEVLPDLVSGHKMATLGISQLTTSQRHLGKPALLAIRESDAWVLSGRSPWVTGARFADWFVLGAATPAGEQLLCLADSRDPKMVIHDAPALVGLTGSQTSQVDLSGVRIPHQQLLAGPTEDLMSKGGGQTGGLQTSALAVGLAGVAIRELQTASAERPQLGPHVAALQTEYDRITAELLLGAGAEAGGFNALACRARANSLVLRATQAALLAAKGSGYVQGHPAGRWCQEALFFLVWSCPGPVAESYFRELSQRISEPTSTA